MCRRGLVCGSDRHDLAMFLYFFDLVREWRAKLSCVCLLLLLFAFCFLLLCAVRVCVFSFLKSPEVSLRPENEPRKGKNSN